MEVADVEKEREALRGLIARSAKMMIPLRAWTQCVAAGDELPWLLLELSHC